MRGLLICILLVILICSTNGTVYTVQTCEHRTMTVSCSDGLTIKVLHANYGRTNASVCPHSNTNDIDCSFPGVLTRIRAICDGERSCSFDVVNSFFGEDDLCRSTHKYAVVQYECQSELLRVNTLLSDRLAEVTKRTEDNVVQRINILMSEELAIVSNAIVDNVVQHVNTLLSDRLAEVVSRTEDIVIQRVNTVLSALNNAACNASVLNDDNYRVPDAAITASSLWPDPACTVLGIRLWGETVDQQWCAGSGNSSGEWVKIDFGVLRSVTGVMLRARGAIPQWITSFKVEYLAGSNWVSVKDSDNNDLVFDGVEEQFVPVYRAMPIPFITTQLKFVPIGYHVHLAARLDIRGC